MKDETGHNESLDRFSSYMKDRLQDHRMEVDPDGWKTITWRIKRRRYMRTAVLVVTMAAVLTGVLWLIIPAQMGTPMEDIITNVDSLNKEEEFTQELLTETIIDFGKKQDSVIHKKVIVEEQKSQSIEDILIKEDPPMIEERKSEIEKDNTKEKKEESTGTDKEENTVKKNKSNHFLPNGYHASRDIAFRKSKKKDDWLLAAAVGTGGNFSLAVNDPKDQNYYYNGEKNNNHIIPTPPKPSVPELPEEYKDADHALPLSFGITVRKKLEGKLAIETGLIYTYLYSRLQYQNAARYRGKQELHYLGIPVNLVVNLWEQDRWNIYFSGGGMVEKGLRSGYSLKGGYTSGMSNIIQKDNIKGLQWSLNAALGISYRFLDHWSLYAEPKMYYYFDTNQPESIRTEHPFGFGISAGMRFQF